MSQNYMSSVDLIVFELRESLKYTATSWHTGSIGRAERSGSIGADTVVIFAICVPFVFLVR